MLVPHAAASCPPCVPGPACAWGFLLCFSISKHKQQAKINLFVTPAPAFSVTAKQLWDYLSAFRKFCFTNVHFRPCENKAASFKWWLGVGRLKHKSSNPASWKLREHCSTGYIILLQMEFQHLPELFDHVASINCFYNSDYFSFQFKNSNMLNLTRIIEMQLGVAAFLFWKIIVDSPLWYGNRRASD